MKNLYKKGRSQIKCKAEEPIRNFSVAIIRILNEDDYSVIGSD